MTRRRDRDGLNSKVKVDWRTRVRTVLIAEEVLLITGGDVVFHGLDKSHLDEATVMVVPPP